MKKQWEDLGTNQILSYKNFYISYNPDTQAAAADHPFGFVQHLGEALGLEHSGEETAIYDKKTQRFYILNGDFRKEYEKIGGNLKKCLEFYNSKEEEFGSNWST